MAALQSGTVDVADRYDRQPIELTGVDSHFVAWTIALLGSIAAFGYLARKLALLRSLG